MVYRDWTSYQTALAAYKSAKRNYDIELSQWMAKAATFDRKKDEQGTVESLGAVMCLGAGVLAYYKSRLGDLWPWLALGFALVAGFETLDVKCRAYQKARFLGKNSRPAFTLEEPTYAPPTDSTQANSRKDPPPSPKPEASMTLDRALAILGLTRNTTLSEIKNHYRERMREYHPDKVAHLGAELKELAARKTVDFNLAYDYASKAFQGR